MVEGLHLAALMDLGWLQLSHMARTCTPHTTQDIIEEKCAAELLSCLNLLTGRTHLHTQHAHACYYSVLSPGWYT